MTYVTLKLCLRMLMEQSKVQRAEERISCINCSSRSVEARPLIGGISVSRRFDELDEVSFRTGEEK